MPTGKPNKEFATEEERLRHERYLENRRLRLANEKRRRLKKIRTAEDDEPEQGIAAAHEREKQRTETTAETGYRHRSERAARGEGSKVMMTAREQIAKAFIDMGDVAGLVRWGREFPTEFYRIWARLIPKEVAEQSQSLPLEELLGKLADRAEMSIEEAAIEIGQETLDKARDQVALEDYIVDPNKIN